MRAPGGRPGDALAKTEQALAQLPKVSGSGAGQVYMAPALAKVFDQAEKVAEKAGDSYVTVERLLLALAMEKESRHQPHPRRCRCDRRRPECRDQ